MIPSLLAREIIEGLRAFVVTGYETTTPYFAGLFGRFVEAPGNLYKGPYLSIALPFEPGTAGRDYFARFTTAFSPHAHQQTAWDRLRADGSPRSTVVATGTGSGKTECFLYPLLDDCVRRAEPGIKAIVIYPMNALANDQAKRFAAAIHGSEALRGQVRVGLFVGEGEHTPHKAMGPEQVITDKDTQREAPPDILLTNYKMLDYLLMRPKDRPLWRYNGPETLRYLVVDELHTFDGAQGTDLACLIRRLKARLDVPPGQMVCVGTSATLGSSEERDDLLRYASRIFQERFDDDAVVGERRQGRSTFLGDALIEHQLLPQPGLAGLLDPDRYDGVEDCIAAQYRLLFQTDVQGEVRDPGWRRALGAGLKRHLLFHNLLRLLEIQPRGLDELVGEMRKTLPAGEAREAAKAVLDGLCALIAWARDPENGERPFVQLRFQLWVRELRRMVTRVEPWFSAATETNPPLPQLLFADDIKQERDALYLPLVQCSECHASAWAGCRPQAQGQLSPDLRAIYNAFFRRSPDLVLLFPLLADEPAPRARGHERYLCGACGSLQAEAGKCQACGREAAVHVYIPDNLKETKVGDVHHLVNEHHCPVCGGRDSLLVFGSRAASLASVAIHHSYATAYNDDKKLIAFSDSVQDAAHRAGFFTARTWLNNVRMVIAQTLDGAPDGRMGLNTFLDFLPRYWTDPGVNPRALEPERYVAELIAPNMRWYPDYRHLEKNGKLPQGSDLVDEVNKRLQWEVLAEFGYRSRVGRSLERTGTAVLGVETEPVAEAARALLAKLREDLGLRDLEFSEVAQFLWGMVLHMKARGAIHHPFLDPFIAEGRSKFVLGRRNFMPGFGRRSAAPLFPTDAARGDVFESLHARRGGGWYPRWVSRCLGRDRLLPDGIEGEVLARALAALTRSGVIEALKSRYGTVWGLDLRTLYVDSKPVRLLTEAGRTELVVADVMLPTVEGMPALEEADLGHYTRTDAGMGHWLRRLYRQGEVRRVLAVEHTGLLERAEREALERQFIAGDRPWYPNLLSATPTLEMGIDIGDLSSVLLCSVPPAQANYLQRIGRAGRRDGNAFSLTLAVGRPHDLYFFAEPLEMMAGRVQTPGVFLDASAVIARQLMAFCLDCWVASGVDELAIPHSMKAVLDNVEKSNLQGFPHNLLDYVSRHAPELQERFLDLFKGEISERTRLFLVNLMADGSAENESIGLRVVKRLYELVQERSRLRSRIDALKRHIDKLGRQPADDARNNELEAAGQERGGLQSVLRAINARETLNFFTDEGLIPNYAFPEAGVTLRSVIYRRRAEGAQGEGGYEHDVYEYERPGAAAISELAPESRFYAGGRQVQIAQVDLELSEVETWRLCPSCSHAENLAAGDHHGACPRCGDRLWGDAGQRVQMVRMRQVMANTSDRESRIGDDVEDREPLFYTRQLLTDFEPEDVLKAYRIADPGFPFGFEYQRKAVFRELNFGEYGVSPQAGRVAGVEAARPGFVLCRHCGMVQSRRAAQQKHAFTCKARNRDDDDNLVRCLYLYREFSSEAVRILLPQAAMVGAERVFNSFIAALQLGLRQEFGGQVDHLRMTSCEEPLPGGGGRKRFLLLYDTVPGGTGYLQDLTERGKRLMGVLRKARDVMAGCPCNADPAQDGCYGCLYAYRNSYGMETTSRDTAVELLSDILAREDQLETTATVGDVWVNPVLGSELEAQFIAAIHRRQLEGQKVHVHQHVVNGKPGYILKAGDHLYTVEPQVPLGPTSGVAVASCPDFLIRQARSGEDFTPIAVFLDGFQYHKDKVTDDTLKRLAIVQSGKYRQWTLTWQDVNPQFATGEIRNPFMEGLHAEMQPLQERFGRALGVAEMMHLAVKPPLEQFLRYLEKPSRERWRGVAMVRALGWFNQARMRSEALADDFRRYLQSECSTAFRELLEEQQDDRAYGGLGYGDVADPLTVRCYLPMDAIAKIAPERLFVSLRLETPGNGDTEAFKAAWQGFHRLYNVLQFLPAVELATSQGAAAAMYEGIPWRYAKAAVAGEQEEPAAAVPGEPELAELIELVAPGVAPHLRRLVQAGVALPEVGFELADADGTVIAEAELAWPVQRIAVVEPQALTSVWIAAGWTVLGLDASGQWVEGVLQDRDVKGVK